MCVVGVSAFPTRISTDGSHASTAGSGVFRDSSAALFQLKGQIRFAILPLFDQYWTAAKYRSIVRSSALAEFGIQHARAIDAQSRLASASIDWLDEKKGVSGMLPFLTSFMSNNPSAPERWLEPGEIIPVMQNGINEYGGNHGRDPIPISLVANYMFCPRRAWLEAVGEKVDSDQIMRGTYDHRKVDRTGGAPDADSFQAVNIRHEEWGVSGKLDAAKMTDDGIVIREYKATPVKRAMIVTEAMRTQLALQAACLEDMGFHVAGTEIFFTTHHRRVDVELDEDDFYQRA